MPKKSKSGDIDAEHDGWKILAKNFALELLGNAKERITDQIKLWINETKQKTIGVSIMIIGLVFFLAGVSILINQVLGDYFPWAGYSLVGILAMGIGYLISNQKV